MKTTDGSEATLSVLKNIFENGSPDGEGGVRYLLGEIKDLSKTAELRILKKLHDEKVINVFYYRRSNNIPYSIKDDHANVVRKNLISDVLSGSRPQSEVTEPILVILGHDKKKLKKKIYSVEQKQSDRPDISKKALKRDRDGTFYLKGKPLMIREKPLSHETIHYKVLCILYEKSDQGGKVSLEVMRKELSKRGVDKESPEKTKRTVDNAISNLFCRTKVGSGQLKNRLPDSRRLIDTYKRKGRFVGWILNS